MQLPALNDPTKWSLFCFGIPPPFIKPTVEPVPVVDSQPTNDEMQTEEVSEEVTPIADVLKNLETRQETPIEPQAPPKITFNPPTMNIISQMDFVTISTLIRFHARWLQSERLTEERGAWLFALLTRLHKPLDPDMASILRSSLKRFCTLRSELVRFAG